MERGRGKEGMIEVNVIKVRNIYIWKKHNKTSKT
jgi:hypothetical protein